MRVGVLELLSGERRMRWDYRAYAYLILKQYASVMPQAISVWCRELGHQVFYDTYFGQKDPEKLLPNDLDVVFISAPTKASALAYALAKLYRQEKTLTVIGGPHAKAFPDDCLRFFDIVIRECDKTLIADILSDVPRGEIVTSGRILRDIPSIQERMPEIRTSAFWRKRPYLTNVIPMLTSLGCPYTCNFCADWDNPYVLLTLDRLEADLRFISENFPRVFVAFHDPNFAVKFDEVCSVLERVPHNGHKWYGINISLSLLQLQRLERLRDTGCSFIGPGIESWTAYSNKSGVGSKVSARQKLEKVVEHIKLIREYVVGIQANFLFGLDENEGDEFVELTKEFMTRLPFVFPNICMLTPFGRTPVFEKYMCEGRILKSMPFAFYDAPYLVTIPRNYSPVTHYEKLIEMYSCMVSWGILLKRLQTTSGRVRFVFLLRTLGERQMLGELRRMLELMKTDRSFRAFHEGESEVLPEYYNYQYERLLGSYANLLSYEDRQPMLFHAQRSLCHLQGNEEKGEDCEYNLITE